MPRGRKTQVRNNIIELLSKLKEAYGYELFEHYIQVFPRVSRRLIYYHLYKGVETGEFEAQEVRREEGDYTWGSMAEKVYYKLGANAEPVGDIRVQKYMEDSISRAYEVRNQKYRDEEKEKSTASQSPDHPQTQQ